MLLRLLLGSRGRQEPPDQPSMAKVALLGELESRQVKLLAVAEVVSLGEFLLTSLSSSFAPLLSTKDSGRGMRRFLCGTDPFGVEDGD